MWVLFRVEGQEGSHNMVVSQLAANNVDQFNFSLYSYYLSLNWE
jgi:hypothetical protein